MNITLVLPTSSHGSCTSDGPRYNKEISMPEGTDISDICAKFNIGEVAEFEYDGVGSGGHVIGKYAKNGKLKDGSFYDIFNFEGKGCIANDKSSIRRFMNLRY
jgi:putative lipase involved disintegration of autophagic bodies